MSERRQRCPDCATEIDPVLRPGAVPGEYVQVWVCPRAASHGTLVPCENGCREQVLNPRAHFSYTPGLLGSGRWSCFPYEAPTCSVIIAQERPVRPGSPLDEFTLPITSGLSYGRECNRSLPCSDHPEPDRAFNG